jgi:hypothetical protein
LIDPVNLRHRQAHDPMNEQATILAAWKRVRPTLGFSLQQHRVDEFFAKAASRTDVTWEELAEEAREKYADVLPEILITLLATDDALIILNAVRLANLNEEREVELLTQFTSKCDAEKHQVSLTTLAGDSRFRNAFRARSDLPDTVRATLGRTRKK